jgi:hypothetical protein
MIPSGTKFVGINPNFPTAERKSAQVNAAQEVYTIEEIALQTSPTLQQVSDTGGLDNGSTIREASVERFGLTGISRVCSQGYEIQFVNGVEYYWAPESYVFQAVSSEGHPPTPSHDNTQGFEVNSVYNDLKGRLSYICTDSATDSAVWLPMAGEYAPGLDNASGAVSSPVLTRAYYSINNGYVDVTIFGMIDVDFSTTNEGIFDFSLPLVNISPVLGTITFQTSNQCNGIVNDNISVFSNDITFVIGDVPFVAKFTYRAY